MLFDWVYGLFSNDLAIDLGTATTLTTMVTVTAAAGTTLAAAYSAQTLTAATSVQWQYNNSNTTWYRLR